MKLSLKYILPFAACLCAATITADERRFTLHSKPFGLEVLQIRFAGQVARYRELAERLGEYLDGRVATIPELDETGKGAYLPVHSLSYRALATGARVF